MPKLPKFPSDLAIVRCQGALGPDWKHPIELPTMTRRPKAPIRIVACVILEYGEQRRFRIKLDVFDFRVYN